MWILRKINTQNSTDNYNALLTTEQVTSVQNGDLLLTLLALLMIFDYNIFKGLSEISIMILYHVFIHNVSI